MYCIFHLKTQEFRETLEQRQSDMGHFQYLALEDYIKHMEYDLTKMLDEWQVIADLLADKRRRNMKL